MALTGSSTVREWLDDPVGGALIRELLAQRGIPEGALAPAFGVPMEQVPALSGGMVSQQVVDDLIAKVAG